MTISDHLALYTSSSGLFSPRFAVCPLATFSPGLRLALTVHRKRFDKLCHGLLTVHPLAFLKNLLRKDHRAEGVDGTLEVLRLGQTVKMKKSVLFQSLLLSRQTHYCGHARYFHACVRLVHNRPTPTAWPAAVRMEPASQLCHLPRDLEKSPCEDDSEG